MEKEQVAALVEENLKTIYAYSLARVSHKEEAEDLAGDIVLAVFQSAPRLRDDNAFFGYLWAIAANTYKKYLSRKKKAVLVELDEQEPSGDDTEDSIIHAEELYLLRRELALLSKEYRECTVAYYFEGLSCSQTAEKLHISLEMVKYYLFKTRLLLKEGIAMEREFGERSYNPAKFSFNTIFSGNFNREYANLFTRRLPGNILHSAYYTPMTIRELSLELGVASVYLEDEIALLEKYHLLNALRGGKYQTNLVIFTESYTQEFRKAAEPWISGRLGEILCNIKKKLPEIRSVGFPGAEAADNSLLWSLLFEVMREGYQSFQRMHPELSEKTELYEGATGVNYGVDYEEEAEYSCNSFAGYSGITEDYAASFADFGILPKANHYMENWQKIRDNLLEVLEGKIRAWCPVVSRMQLAKIKEILSEEITALGSVYEELYRCASQIMKVHAPKNVEEMVEYITGQTIFFRTVGFLGACAVHAGVLAVPQDRNTLPVLVYEAGGTYT